MEHPGIRPRLIYRGCRDDIMSNAGAELTAAFVGNGIRRSSMRPALVNAMKYAIERMGEALDEAAPGTRVDGKLEGETAGAVWRSEAVVEQID